jgi:hypothetical protein
MFKLIRGLILKAIYLTLQRFSPETRTRYLFRIWGAVQHKMTPLETYRMNKEIYDRHNYHWPVLSSDTQTRIYGFFHLISAVTGVPGDVVECGVGRGNSLSTLMFAVTFFNLNKKVYGFDSFEGFPNASEHDLGTRVFDVGKPNGWTDTSMEMINEIFEPSVQQRANSPKSYQSIAPILTKGYFEDTLPDNLPDQICFLHVDCDLYESVRVVLESCFPRMSPGAIVILDEHHSEKWPGARKAADQVCSAYGLTIEYFNEVMRYGIRIPGGFGAEMQDEK